MILGMVLPVRKYFYVPIFEFCETKKYTSIYEREKCIPTLNVTVYYFLLQIIDGTFTFQAKYSNKLVHTVSCQNSMVKSVKHKFIFILPWL